MKEFKELLDKKGYRPLTVKLILFHVKVFETWSEKESLSIKKIKYKDIMTYVLYLKKETRQARTINHHLSSIEKYYDFLIGKKIVLGNPCRKIIIKGSIKKVSAILRKEELHQLYDDFKLEHHSDYRDKVMVGLMIYQGLPTRALMELEVDDLKLEEGKILVKGNHRTNRRILTLESKQMVLLVTYIEKIRETYINSYGKEHGLMFSSFGNGEKIHNVLSILNSKLKKRYSFFTDFRQIRTSVIVHWLKTNDTRMVQYWSGHRHISSTEKYKQYDMDNLKQIIEEFHPFNLMDKDHK